VDPGFAQPEFEIELRQRGRLDGHFYKADNAVVWLFLRGLCHGTTAWNLISPLEARRNGRGAYIALLAQFMGSDVEQVNIRNSEQFLATARFTNENKNHTFPKFTSHFRQALNDFGPDDQLSERRKVTKLMQAWQVPELMHLDAMVTGDPVRSQNLEAAITFLSDQLASLKNKNTYPMTRRLSAVEQSSDDEGSPKKQKTQHSNAQSAFDPDDPTKYLPAKAWRTLTEDQKAAARRARAEADSASEEEEEAPPSEVEEDATSVSGGE